ncbi:helicase-associated domain-containing protein [Paenibacillus aurantiacus]|uniref:Helicase-associated domain-containing protein n=1 Tax=Paenibacillus aurantiacus TaxID=1936118 RepID=A0ABV5KZC3_9BACL
MNAIDEARKSVERLSLSGRQTLQTVIEQFGMLPFHDEQLLRYVHPGYSGAEYRLGMLELELAGLVKGYRKGWGDKVYLIPPRQFRGCWQAVSRIEAPDAIDESMVLYNLSNEEAPIPFGERLMHGLAEVAKCGLAQTAKGSWPKRTVERVVRALAMKEDELDPLHLAAREPGCPLPFALFLDFAVCEGWLVQEGREYRLDVRRLLLWLKRTQADRDRTLAIFWTETYSAAEPSLAKAAAFVAEWPCDRWYSPAVVAVSDHALVKSITAWCRLMANLGWMEEAALFDGQQVYRWTVDLNEDIAEPAETLYARIAPDGDIFVPREASQIASFGLELIARRATSDFVVVYRLESDSVRKAIESGVSSKQVFDFLTAVSGEEVPAALAVAIEGWISEAAGSIREKGKSHGFAVSLSDLMRDEIEPSPATPTPGGRPVLLPHDTNGMTELKPADPAIHFQGLDSLPVSWRSQMRAYHPSTRRELVERALSWRTAVKLTIRGEVVPFIPDKLVEDEGGWCVSGDLRWDGQVERTQLTPHMWDEMMLLIPEFTKH